MSLYMFFQVTDIIQSIKKMVHDLDPILLIVNRMDHSLKFKL